MCTICSLEFAICGKIGQKIQDTLSPANFKTEKRENKEKNFQAVFWSFYQ
ncbi:hypothetical protein M2101_000993 [Parabacteroides sp. PM5-20]|nr:hypothetical protein [Parabacteroides sp. PM5-20]